MSQNRQFFLSQIILEMLARVLVRYSITLIQKDKPSISLKGFSNWLRTKTLPKISLPLFPHPLRPPFIKHKNGRYVC